MNNSDIKKDFKALIKGGFDTIQSSLNGSTNSDVNLARKHCFDDFFTHGLPTLKFENWKYVNLSFLNKLDLQISTSEINANDIVIKDLYYSSVDSSRVVLVNGIYSKELSDEVDVSDLKISFLSSTVSSKLENYSDYYGKLVNNSEHTFANINTALSENVLVIEVGKNSALAKPIQIVNITDSRKNSILTNPRILLICETGSSCQVIESNYTIGEFPAVKNIVKEIFLKDNAQLKYYKIQDDSEQSYTFDFSIVQQGRDSHFDESAVSINGKFVRNDLRAVLDGENIESHFYGVFIVGNSDIVDNHTIVDHAKPNCFSNENYRGILFDKSSGVFNGKILVRRDAQKTNAYQSNKNVLLSNNATINTKPELEIYADDVKCSHGATSGALDKTSLFYLKARGIGEKMAEVMLLNAFAIEVINEIKIEKLRELILNRIENKLNTIYK